MNLPLLLKVLHQVEQLHKHEHWTRAQLEAYQATALHQLRNYAYTHSPFYQKFHSGLTDRPLRELPVLTKAMLMEHFDELVTDRRIHLDAVRAHAASDVEGKRFLNHYWLNATSGSSGHPGFFLFNEAEWVMILASFARAREWAGVRTSLTHQMKMASVASTSPFHMSAQVSATVKSWWMPALRLAASDPLPELVRRLNAWQPELLIAYASMLRILAEEQLAERLHIHPRMVWASSEVLTDETRRRAEAAWGSTPFNEYASTETASIASECKEGRHLHLYEDLVLVEVVDEAYRPVPPGVYGAKVLVTTLFSRTQPLIRYELNDSVRLMAEPCACERTFALLQNIQGRAEDTLYLPGATDGKVAVRPLVFNRIMDLLPVTGWQLIQEINGLTILLSGVPIGFSDERLINNLTQTLTEIGVHVPSIHIQHVSTIPKNAAGKAPLIVAADSNYQADPAHIKE